MGAHARARPKIYLAHARYRLAAFENFGLDYSSYQIFIPLLGGGEDFAIFIQHTLEKMARVTRLELATSGVTGQRSNQLSYTPVMWNAVAPRKWELFTPQPLDCQARSDAFSLQCERKCKRDSFLWKKPILKRLKSIISEKLRGLAP